MTVDLLIYAILYAILVTKIAWTFTMFLLSFVVKNNSRHFLRRNLGLEALILSIMLLATKYWFYGWILTLLAVTFFYFFDLESIIQNRANRIALTLFSTTLLSLIVWIINNNPGEGWHIEDIVVFVYATISCFIAFVIKSRESIGLQY